MNFTHVLFLELEADRVIGAGVLQKTKLSPEEQERVDAVVIFGESLSAPPLATHSLGSLASHPCLW